MHLPPVEYALTDHDMTWVGEDKISDVEDMFLGYKLSHIQLSVRRQTNMQLLSGVVK